MNKTYLLLFMLFWRIITNAQSSNIIGTVVDAQTKEELIGANVFLLNTAYGSATDNMLPPIP